MLYVFYKFNKAPFISDLRKYIKNFKFNKYKFKKDQALKPLHQLFCVLPPQLSFLLPSSYKFLTLNSKSPLIFLFPRDFKLDMINKTKYWQCEPIIPMIEFSYIEILEKYNLSENELLRNRKESIIEK